MLQATDLNFKKLKIRIKNDYTPEIGEGLDLATIPKEAKASVDTLIRMGAIKIVEAVDDNAYRPANPSPIQENNQPAEEIVSLDPQGSKKKSNQGGGK
jgi:hypothetical protein